MEDKKLYVLKVVSGHENKIKNYIEIERTRSKWEDIILNVYVPTEKVYKIRAGKRVIAEKTLYPGYMYIEVNEKLISSEILATIRSISGVMNFLGGTHPQALRQSEVNKLFGKMDDMLDVDATMLEPFILNESVKIIEGPFMDFVGQIDEINEDKKKLKVIVKIFGRKQPVEVGFTQVEKIN